MRTPSWPRRAVRPEQALSARALLTDLYWAGVRAVSPGPALTAALEKIAAEWRGRNVWIIAIGKAANAMAVAAVDVLHRRNLEPVGGMIIAPRLLPSPHPAIEYVVGDHPLPGENSFAAAMRLQHVTARVGADDEVWVLLSGGATSLAAGPEGAIKPDELLELYELLLGSGLDIADMNLIRKRFSRWGAGRLAVALARARVRNFIVSDVIGDDLAAIGSGPCTPDPSTASEIRTILTSARLWDDIPAAMRRYLNAVERDPSLETPEAGNDAFARVERRIIASNRVALEAIAARARELGYAPRILGTALAGEAAIVGGRLATTLATYRTPSMQSLPGSTGRPCLIWGGETTVTLGSYAGGLGGRCQELALAAARELARSDRARDVALLAAGTDGRDGPTDAAGAVVDHDTWEAIRRAGRDPERDLSAHDSHRALESAGALLRTDLTATNVMDVVIGIIQSP